jgi:hypothetical protein
VAFEVPDLSLVTQTSNPGALTHTGEIIGYIGTTITAAQTGATGHLRSGDAEAYEFLIGVRQRRAISFVVDAVGDATSGPCVD